MCFDSRYKRENYNERLDGCGQIILLRRGFVKGTCVMLLLARHIRDVVVMVVGDMKIRVGYCARNLTFQNS